MNRNKEFEHIHINTGGKQFSEEELKEAQDFMKSDEVKKEIEKAKAQHKRVMESKITERFLY